MKLTTELSDELTHSTFQTAILMSQFRARLGQIEAGEEKVQDVTLIQNKIEMEACMEKAELNMGVKASRQRGSQQRKSHHG